MALILPVVTFYLNNVFILIKNTFISSAICALLIFDIKPPKSLSDGILIVATIVFLT